MGRLRERRWRQVQELRRAKGGREARVQRLRKKKIQKGGALCCWLGQGEEKKIQNNGQGGLLVEPAG
jgi:hypothetical protein